MARTGENIYKRKDGRWEARYILSYGADGKAKHRSLYAKTYREVKNKLICARAAPPCSAPASPQAARRYAAWLEDWLQFQRPRVKESTYVRYVNLIRQHIAPGLGRYQPELLSTGLLEQYLTGLLTFGRLDGTGGLAPKTVSDILAIIKGSLRYAAAHGAAAPCQFEHLTPPVPPKEIRVLSREEEARLAAVLLADTDRIKAGVLLALYTGLRIGELCALTGEDLALDAGTLHVHATVQRLQVPAPAGNEKTRLLQTSPKSVHANRIIPLPDFMAELLRPLNTAPNAYFLTGSERCMEPRTLQNRFKGYLRQSGVPNANFHALRHTFATRCVEAGFDVKSLSEILGHASVKITLDRYVHSSLQQKRENMARLALPAQ